jgi:hypothetical protein
MGMTVRRGLWTAVKALAVPLVLVLLYLVLRRIGFGGIVQAMAQVSRLTVGAALALYLAVFVLWVLRWQQLMKRGTRRSVAALFPIYMAGVFGNVITPGARVGGEPIRAYYMSRIFGGEKSAHLGTVLADKLANGVVFLVLLLASVVFAVLFVPLSLGSKIVLEGSVLFIVLAVLSGVLLRKRIGIRSRLLGRLLPLIYGSRLLKFIRRRFPTYQLFEDYAVRKLDNLTGPIGRAAGSPKAIAKIMTISGASWALIYLAHYVLFVGLGADISFMKVMVIVTVSTLCGDLSVSPGGAGFMEAAMIALCAAFGVDHRTAAAVTIMSRGIFYLFGLGLGGLCLAGLACLYGRRK